MKHLSYMFICDCLTCKKSFLKDSKTRKYCSLRCFHDRNINLFSDCEFCAKKFKPYKHHGKYTRFCSIPCCRKGLGNTIRNTSETFWRRVEKDINGCWIYTKDTKYLKINGVSSSAPRYAFEFIHGRKPEGPVYRTCKNYFCVYHLADSKMRKECLKKAIG
jgi:hypothetical protein